MHLRICGRSRHTFPESLALQLLQQGQCGRFLETIGRLERFPLRNGILATLPDGRVLRRAKAANYLALYVTTDSTVSVLAVIYGRSDVEKRLARLF